MASHAHDESEVVVAIVNYRTPQLVVDCLRSLAVEHAADPIFDVIIADNASGDGSVGTINAAIDANGWADWARVLPLSKNGGFAYGNNAVVREAQGRRQLPRFVWLLNSDTVVRPGALQALVGFADERGDVDMIGSRMEYPDGQAQVSAFRFPSILGEFEGNIQFGPVSRLLRSARIAPPQKDATDRCDWVAGASVLIKWRVFEKIGLMDEDYFLYYEETDFCLRAARAGLNCYYLPQSRVVHLIGATTQVTSKQTRTKRRPGYWYESRKRYFVKNYGFGYSVLADVSALAGAGLHKLRCLLERRPTNLPHLYLVDIVRHTVHFPVRSQSAREHKF